MKRGSLWIWAASGCGAGWLPWAPGTWGSLVGGVLGAALAPRVSPPTAAAMLLGALALFAWISGKGEQALGAHDPASVVLDEVWGMAAVLLLLPEAARSWPRLLTAFALFRFFDIVKPPPLRRLARLPGGWGIMADDVGAAAFAWGILRLSLLAGWL